MQKWLAILSDLSKRAPVLACDKSDGTKHPWTKQEDARLRELVMREGPQNWSTLALQVRRQVRVRFVLYRYQ